MQILDPEFEIHLVVVPRHTIHAGGGFTLKRVKRRPERIDTDMVEERGELFLLPLPCGLPYAAQRLGHASPALRPVRALLIRVPLGPRPWLRRLRHRSPGFVRRLRRYYAGVRLLWVVHQRLRLLTFPLRTIRPPTGPMADPEISRFPHKERPYMPGSQTTPGPTGARNNAPADFAFRQVNNVGTRISRLNGWPIRSPTDASPTSSRTPAHGSEATWIATFSSQWTFTTYSLPVSRRTHSRCGLHTRAVTNS